MFFDYDLELMGLLRTGYVFDRSPGRDTSDANDIKGVIRNMTFSYVLCPTSLSENEHRISYPLDKLTMFRRGTTELRCGH